ncbi:MAG TPA: TIM-barrel domain-containing protein [Terracidiphilus sp.]|nr:TIM-barrel domain-containing protein [Terracidiphilus sp.]
MRSRVRSSLRIFTAGIGASILAILPISPLRASSAPSAPPSMEQRPDGIGVRLPAGELRLQVLSDSIVRVEFSRSPAFFDRTSIDRVALPQDTHFTASATKDAFVLTTAKLRAVVDRAAGSVSFTDLSGTPLLSEVPGSRVLESIDVQGEQTDHVQQKWEPQQDESLYGLGQQQLGIVDIKDYDLDLWQHNTRVVVPFLVSSKGYGILWDNTSYTRFGDLRPFADIPAEDLYDANGNPGGLTATDLDGHAPPHQTADIGIHLPLHPDGCDQDPSHCPAAPRESWIGSILAPNTGDYQFRAYSNGGIKVWFDGKLIMDHWRQRWLTDHDQVLVHLEAGHRYPIRIENDPEQQNTLDFQWKTPPPDEDTSLWSQVGDGIDYYFVYGPSIDKVIAGYRLLTGRATMLPDWAFGLWQSRQRYQTQDQSLDVVREFRARQIPFDNIVQDWQYWTLHTWGSHRFDPTRFPDPDAWIRAIHAEHAHLMISVWGKFNPSTDNGKAMLARGYLYMPNLREHILDWLGQPYSFYDAFNPGARKLFWAQIDQDLFSKGIDAWWMDATEPDLMPSPTLDGQRTHMNPTYLGTGSRMLNGYALENSKGVYTGQREAAPNQRVFILTRSGFAGIQRYSTAIWSGDTTSTWTALAKQIDAGLGASISGLPWWTMDTGGYTMQHKFAEEPMTEANREEWRELNARWFELSTFTPILRVHGELRPREMWTLGVGSPAYDAELNFDRLRYALYPYIYSMAGWTVQRSYTMMRPLVMDFPADRTARNLTQEYMFGPAFLVAPIVHYKQREREVYLPSEAAWYDFWTGQPAASDRLTAPAPYDQIPIFVRAGSIVPYAPPMQYVAQKPDDPVTLYIYAGADGKFTLYEDQGTNFNYEKGAFSLIPIRWDDQTATLTIGKRTGAFEGMLDRRTFHVVLVSKDHPAGFSFAPVNNKSVSYSGDPVSLKLE